MHLNDALFRLCRALQVSTVIPTNPEAQPISLISLKQGSVETNCAGAGTEILLHSSRPENKNIRTPTTRV